MQCVGMSVSVLVLLVVITMAGVCSAQKTANVTFCSRECYAVDGAPGCGKSDLAVVATPHAFTCYPGPGTFRGDTKWASYAPPNVYSVVFYSDAHCSSSHTLAATSRCLAGRCCVGDFYIPPSHQDNRGDVPFFFVSV
ncbi:uncharacterized protein ACA1_153940 [Acanthamoeba castellanii str. Neff]|uniref:Uncharacterized protein n=1 Tax=Acanthamoeba castellanii (strain ATCC 30010 / Neff) TaxID=1257118 RepID=L8H2C2_ACACF|nr:uncharacterized protein ACA1_153940 [Acanthamoeba castellanii str. Neff]ELR18531.1 hypothetical protein ACA1_153940 [Acanthamoeba castellanii str. Neff]